MSGSVLLPFLQAFDLDGLEDDPTFWDMKLDTDSPTRDKDAPGKSPGGCEAELDSSRPRCCDQPIEA